MIQHPAIIALLSTSLLTAFLLGYAAWHGAIIRRRWDITSGSELQLTLERRTYLISAILAAVLVFQILSLFLFIFTADALHTRLAGAMCAAGSLNANQYGYPVLLLKIITCLMAGTWLIINHADTRGYDYPLIRQKYALLNLLTPLVLLETLFTVLYFGGLKADVITSCCGSLFSQAGGGLAGEMASLPAGPMRLAVFSALAVTTVAGLFSIRTGRGAGFFAVSAAVTFFISVAGLISFVCLYIYELPTHHCPFCILQKEYHYVGYLLYASLLGGGICGAGAGVLIPYAGVASLKNSVPGLQRTLTVASLAGYLIFGVVVAVVMAAADFRLE